MVCRDSLFRAYVAEYTQLLLVVSTQAIFFISLVGGNNRHLRQFSGKLGSEDAPLERVFQQRARDHLPQRSLTTAQIVRSLAVNNLLPQPVEAAEIVIFYVSTGLAQFPRDLMQGKALQEE